MSTTYQLKAPATPGAQSSVIGTFPTIAEAREAASHFRSRRDLRGQDVRIETLRTEPRAPLGGPGVVVVVKTEFVGPPR